ncbi:hypothetical protein psageK4_113 [Pseudomonas phage psageK4]|uniref:Uncharacterized protein n=4 Tax=Otagovirus TaxID=2560197 RepID=A0A7G9V2G6_9CAUD|nr:hypothetical protein QGX14_gp122 [Pseudomonas phage psageK4]YP_010767030.1 hypothetical protein QGX15_gp122 [Pseudomonas phage psageK4e]YP_010767199.1 hypothetical protein QGX16_gp116 [Pseudomonas phage phiPsa397]YP_010767545.1 hypothetical protein QGX18_gp119 [Pseudomonas phage phiPsa347]QNO00472.1 hypothetical protein phiPsa347_109 [Pseudomonas phage phiPsa347]QNO00818.1 hypothetical protein phiPsa397_109 [Pseudomonas phage phiPsa397]QXV71767.1 hypothetical protein psageK4_113 [Pseudomon
MASVPTLNGNTIMIPFPTINAAWDFCVSAGLTQFAVRELPDGFSLATPITASLEDKIPGILHGARARAKPQDKPKPPTGGGDGTPPSGGTPGSTSVWQQTFTEARAA